MLPTLALMGRPNVGKSTLFNRLTQSREALVADQPGLTRDRQYGVGKIGDKPYIVVDTGGLTGADEGLEGLVAEQAWLAVREADAVLFLVDGRAGLNATDEAIAARLRQYGKRVFLVVNKMEGRDAALDSGEFHAVGLGTPYAISSAHGHGVESLMDEVLAVLPEAVESEEEAAAQGIKIAVVGRPNVGKSTLVNRMLGEERVLAYDQPGTTRDSIYIPFERKGQQYTLIDTAGVRRRARVTEAIEKFSIIKTLQAIEHAHVVIVVLDAQHGISDQDAGLLGFVLEAGRALVIAVNKWDGLPLDQRSRVKQELERKLPFVEFAKVHYISALRGTRVVELFASVQRAYASAGKQFPTPQLTRILEQALAEHQPPLVHGRRIKLRYAHQGGHYPPIIIIHGNQTEAVPETYRRYLSNTFRDALQLEGTPLRIEFKAGENPYKGRKNVLSPRQAEKRRRLLRHVKKR